MLADFVFQSNDMAKGKQSRDPLTLGLHGGIVLVASVVTLGTWHWGLLGLTAVHLAIDFAKSFAPKRLWAFLADQGLHLVTLAAVALWLPGLWAGGLWATGGWPAGWFADPLWTQPLWAPALMALVAGIILATRAGGFAVGLLMQDHADGAPPDGLPKGGATIGVLERGLVFLLVLAGQPGGVGFLIAAKSVLRFSTTASDRSASEYVIIGTLASFGWALATAWATIALLAHLPPIGIPPVSP